MDFQNVFFAKKTDISSDGLLFLAPFSNNRRIPSPSERGNLSVTAPSHCYHLPLCDQEVFLSEQTDFLQDIPANTDIFLAFKTQFKNVQNRFFRHDETFPGDLSNLL
jgi:hypothetical protein